MAITLIGAGGIGAPAAWALCEAGVRNLVVVDDDAVELGNLHRQIVFEDEDLGRPKAATFARRLEQRYRGLAVQVVEGRALPDSVMDLVRGAEVVIDATDNFASRFLLADACHLAAVPVVHAAAVRWQATVMAVPAGGKPCYRCLFEDIPAEGAPDCASAGVVGPVCGVSGAVAADRALSLASGRFAGGEIVTYDGRSDRLRSVRVTARRDCRLCGTAQISAIEESRYVGAHCEPW